MLHLCLTHMVQVVPDTDHWHCQYAAHAGQVGCRMPVSARDCKLWCAASNRTHAC